jgi:hypothetical protein
MPRWTKTVQANFTHGEFAPEVWGRIDTKLYGSGLRHGLNGALKPQGGIRLRPGTDLWSAFTVDVPCRLAGMFYNPNEEYLFHFEAGTVFIYDAINRVLLTQFSGLPWTTADMPKLYAMSIQGTLVVCSQLGTFWPIRIMRHDVNLFGWDVFPFEFSPDGAYCYMPYYKFAPAPMTLKPSAVGPGTMTITSNAPFFSTKHDDISAQGMHVHFTITYPADPVKGTLSETHTLLCTAVTDNQTATMTLLGTKPLPNILPQVQWREQVFSPVWGYPRCVGYHDQRLLFAGHPYAPGLFLASQSGAPYNFDIGTAQDDEAIWAVISTESSNQIRSILSGHHLTIFTSQGPFYYPGSDTNPLTPGTVSFRRTSASQCSWTPPVLYDLAAQYVQRRGGHVREMIYDLYKQSYTADATTLLSAHLVNEPTELVVVQPDAAGNQNQYLLALNQDGTAACYLGDRAQEIAGWLPWTTKGTIMALGAVGENAFMCVERTINGITATNLERVNWTTIFDNSSYYSSPTPTSVFTTAAWTNTTVDVIGDGYYMGQVHVDGAGRLTLPAPYTARSIVIGFSFPINWQTMAVDQMFADGPKQGRPYSLASTVVRLYNTEAIRVNGHRLWVRLPKDPTGAKAPLYTGSRELFLNGWGTELPITMTLDYPCQVEVDSFNIEMTS